MGYWYDDGTRMGYWYEDATCYAVATISDAAHVRGYSYRAAASRLRGFSPQHGPTHIAFTVHYEQHQATIR
eukprot:scaffold532823_cov28-Prasinocladus_malaysianus.AAC.1